MKTTYGKITQAIEALGKLSKLDIKVSEAVRVSRLISAVDCEMKTFNEVRLKICEKYGKSGESGMYEFSEENGKKFSKELSELLETEVELSCDEVKICSPITIDAASVISLSGFVDFKEENNG